jgi:hypothetical protein
MAGITTGSGSAMVRSDTVLICEGEDRGHIG